MSNGTLANVLDGEAWRAVVHARMERPRGRGIRHVFPQLQTLSCPDEKSGSFRDLGQDGRPRTMVMSEERRR